MRSDTDMQVMLLSNMILTGGTACIDGLSERLKTEGTSWLHFSCRVSTRIHTGAIMRIYV